MKLSKTDAKKKFPKAFVGAGGCDPILLEPGGKFELVNRKLHLSLPWGEKWVWNQSTSSWNEQNEE